MADRCCVQLKPFFAVEFDLKYIFSQSKAVTSVGADNRTDLQGLPSEGGRHLECSTGNEEHSGCCPWWFRFGFCLLVADVWRLAADASPLHETP